MRYDFLGSLPHFIRCYTPGIEAVGPLVESPSCFRVNP